MAKAEKVVDNKEVELGTKVEEPKAQKEVVDLAPQPVSLTSDRFVLELREDGYYNVRSRDNNMLLVVGVSDEDVLAHYV